MENLAELLGSGDLFSTLLPLAVAHISPVAGVDPRVGCHAIISIYQYSICTWRMIMWLQYISQIYEMLDLNVTLVANVALQSISSTRKLYL